MKIREMREEDIESFIDCEARIWETLREHLPEEFVERNLNWIIVHGSLSKMNII
jgi:hypothetical protein